MTAEFWFSECEHPEPAHRRSLVQHAMTLSESQYIELAQRELEQLLRALDEVGEELEVELSNDILVIEFPDQDGKFVINSHRAARQIWMAAGNTAWHFDYAEARWVASKTGQELWSVVREQLSAKLGRPLDL